MTRPLDFIISTFQGKVKPKPGEPDQPPVDSDYPAAAFDTTTTVAYYDAQGNKLKQDPPKTEKIVTGGSLFNSDVYINYRGDDSPNTYAKKGKSFSHESDISFASIVAWSQQHPSIKLHLRDVAYIRNIGVYPANRMIVLRRFTGGSPDDLFATDMVPLATVVGFIPPEEDDSAFSINFSEKWEPNVKEGLIDVVNKIIGFSNKSALLPNFEGASNVEQALAVRLGEVFGVTTSGDNPKGNPNVIHEAAIRTTEYDGLSCKFKIQFTTEYEIQYVRGADPGRVYTDLIGNLVRMGTSPEQYITTPQFGGAARQIQKMLEDNDFSGLALMIFKVFKEGVGDLVKLVGEALNKVKNIAVTGVKAIGGDEKAKQELVNKGTAAAQKFITEINKIIGINVRRYTWPLKGAIAAMSGFHTGPWHVTIGNPKSPFVSVGNLIIEDVKIDLGTNMLYNDRPSRIKVTYALGPGRNRGASGITSIFNVGKGRIYQPIEKTRTLAITQPKEKKNSDKK